MNRPALRVVVVGLGVQDGAPWIDILRWLSILTILVLVVFAGGWSVAIARAAANQPAPSSRPASPPAAAVQPPPELQSGDRIKIGSFRIVIGEISVR